MHLNTRRIFFLLYLMTAQILLQQLHFACFRGSRFSLCAICSSIDLQQTEKRVFVAAIIAPALEVQSPPYKHDTFSVFLPPQEERKCLHHPPEQVLFSLLPLWCWRAVTRLILQSIYNLINKESHGGNKAVLFL